MNCQKCGTPLTQNDQFCKGCGAPNPMLQQNNNNATQQAPQNTFTIPPIQQTGQPMMQNQNPMENNINTMQNYTQPVNNTPTMNYESPKGKKDNSALLILIGIVGMIILVIGSVFIGHSMGKKSTCSTSNNSNTQTKEEATYKVKFQGFSMQLPTNVTYTIKGDYLNIKNNETNVLTQISFNNSDFSEFKSNLELIEEALKEDGFTQVEAKIKTVNNIELIVVELEKSYEYLTIIAKASSGYVAGINILDLKNESTSTEKIEFAAKIISSLKYIGETSNMEVEQESYPFPEINFEQ